MRVRIGALCGAMTLAGLAGCGGNDAPTASAPSVSQTPVTDSGPSADEPATSPGQELTPTVDEPTTPASPNLPTLKIGIKFDQPGLGQKVDGTYKGFDVDVATYIARELGFTPEFIESPSAQREKMLQAGTVSMVVASYAITEKRKVAVSFAGPYFVAGQSVLVKSDSGINSLADLAGKRACPVRGSTSVDNLKKKQPNLTLQEYGGYAQCMEPLMQGAVDVLTTDDTILAGLANQPAYQGKVKLIGGTFSQERYGVGLKKGDVEICTKINAAIRKMIDDGSWAKFVKNNFGENYSYTAEFNPPKTYDVCS